jgi:hypothetical protein
MDELAPPEFHSRSATGSDSCASNTDRSVTHVLLLVVLVDCSCDILSSDVYLADMCPVSLILQTSTTTLTRNTNRCSTQPLFVCLCLTVHQHQRELFSANQRCKIKFPDPKGYDPATVSNQLQRYNLKPV